MQDGRPAGTDLPFRATVPNRVDLAGGTLDIYPLYLLVPGSTTVNAAIGISSTVTVLPSRGPCRLFSEDLVFGEEAPDTHGFSPGGRLGLIASALRFFPPFEKIEICLRNEAPLGSGLGASSALLVAAMLAMDALRGRRRGWEEISRAAMEIEAAHLRSLAGRQDHIAALRGGISGIRFLPGRVEAERIGAGAREGRKLAAHGFLAGTGKSHRSADVNWRMIRGAIEGNREVLRKFRGIASAARDAWQAVRCGGIEEAGRAVGREWAIRKTLARGVSVGKVERVLSSREFRDRVTGAKLCGAGGGGMLFGLLREPGERRAVEAILRSEGFSIHPFLLSAGPRLTGGGTASRQALPREGNP